MKNLSARSAIFTLFGFLAWNQSPLKAQNETYKADIVIYGGTSAAVTAAVQATKMKKSVIMISPDIHLGGLTSGGLGFTDTGDKSVIGGLSREFYHRVYLHYQRDSAWKWQKKEAYGNKGQGTPAMDGAERTMWIFEPHVAEQIMNDFIKEHKIKVLKNEWLNRNNGVEMRAGKIVSIKTLSGKKITGKMFIDATYEGDLMATAKVSYHVGREANSTYGEKWNGVQVGVFQHGHHFKTNISAYQVPGDKNSGLLAGISTDAPGKQGSGDHKLQAYCFRMCLTNIENNRLTFPKPDHYNPKNYELLARVFESGWSEVFNKYDPLPNHKTDTNNHGPFSTDYIGMNYDYPEASYEKRKAIIKQHEDYQKGLMYFMATDPRVPKDLQKKINTWGLAKDEFKDNGNWPHQIYVREARRMIGDYVMSENEVLGIKAVSNSIGMGSYALDSHHTQRYVDANGFVQNEGDIGVKAPKPYAIPYQAIVPKKSECKNLFVPVCLSVSHIAYGSIRMEPVFMILGESAATAAALAIDQNTAIQDLPYGDLKSALLKQNQKLNLN
ncbi:FAD-dependent oxidoreductase [Pedobacter sp. MC2016-24]|uniref:FAD-dependent oxidoreductase n=1 Tax=Pedobacter sp. MC2016-24 TaxID=2780090 RepID=UPI00188006B9|nr:FAD-dependent oxidoreductase [Pedobacter sp. MC2016-24]MBE9601223.1 FAD-dependent oxidoreductase [Pedobacter sp. MC2016-24]